ncbi:uncharacterized protein BDZ99DRAFT_569585 [Mytilinidion resinicola]|uniref:Uncharacterized protein n=1 Tax=Mytilinidion resinicola TaxID=574789 RepID=A0A6A6YS28_9PEZI|nr:uncharacterized protein BDZ99DRAFT_569585 [Mytilinidion resinicola]KAF2811581.1 hypothetical protein BDZ99DRAFT_569585 [Mytilinidion resinicola]
MSGILSSLTGVLSSLGGKIQGVIDRLFPPEKRAEWISRLQAFAVSNPKLAGFLLTNIALTGLPLLTFLVFTLTVFVFSLAVALLVGLLAALLFTAFMVGLALLLVLPTVFLTTMGATFLFLWGLGGYYILMWFNEGSTGQAPEGDAIGDKLNSLAGGRLGFLTEGGRKKERGELLEVGSAGEVGENAEREAQRGVDGVKQRAGKGASANGDAKGADAKGDKRGDTE